MLMLKRIMVVAVVLMCMAAMPAIMCGAEQEEAPKHEMRGAWVATVYGIDWPNKTGTDAATAKEQKRELCEILDTLKNAGMNAVMFQVRSMSDAMYRSAYEPWSAYLTGTRGEAPVDGWDPLAFAVEEAHARGMELHAWVNPFRLGTGSLPSAQRAASGKRTFSPVEKGWVISFSKDSGKTAKTTKRGKKRVRSKTAASQKSMLSILDPGNEEARKHIVDVCSDIVTHYDVDGLIFDDYFYPDRLPLGGGYDFNEWKKQCVGKDGKPTMSQADWRRANVSATIAAVREMLQTQAPWVRFGISPAGVGGGNGKATEPYGLIPPKVGDDWMYDRIYCNPIDWLHAGTVDYVSPQIYWASTHETNPYVPIAQWWAMVAHHFGRHCYPSQKVLAVAEGGTKAWAEQRLQTETNRAASQGNDAGSVYYSTAHITGKKAAGLGTYLKQHIYSSHALMPPMQWKKMENPGQIENLTRSGSELRWKNIERMRYVVYAVPNELTPFDVLSATGTNFMGEYIVAVTYTNSFSLPKDKRTGYWYAVAPYDRAGNEWEAAILNDK